jgi:hypothetical protein
VRSQSSHWLFNLIHLITIYNHWIKMQNLRDLKWQIMSKTLGLHNVNKTCIPFEVSTMSSENIHFCNTLSTNSKSTMERVETNLNFHQILCRLHIILKWCLFSTQLPYDLDSPSSLKPTTTKQVILLLQTHH